MKKGTTGTQSFNAKGIGSCTCIYRQNGTLMGVCLRCMNMRIEAFQKGKELGEKEAYERGYQVAKKANAFMIGTIQKDEREKGEQEVRNKIIEKIKEHAHDVGWDERALKDIIHFLSPSR